MALASFDILGFGVVFSRAPQRPERSLSVLQPRRQSAGGVRFGYARTIAHKTLRLALRLTAAEKAALLDFFTVTARGMTMPFFYHTTQGDVMIVQFASATLPPITEKAYDTWETTLELRAYST